MSAFSARSGLVVMAAVLLLAIVPMNISAKPSGVRGCIAMAPDGQPVVSATITSLNEAGISTITDAAGMFVLATPTRNPLIAIRKAGFVGRTVQLGNPVGCVWITRAGSIAGRVADEEGEPVEGATVTRRASFRERCCIRNDE